MTPAERLRAAARAARHPAFAVATTVPLARLILPPATADGTCDRCADPGGPVRITPEGLLCDDCYDAEPQPYDPFDPYEKQDEGWGW